MERVSLPDIRHKCVCVWAIVNHPVLQLDCHPHSAVAARCKRRRLHRTLPATSKPTNRCASCPSLTTAHTVLHRKLIDVYDVE
jgi:hypothetical protein